MSLSAGSVGYRKERRGYVVPLKHVIQCRTVAVVIQVELHQCSRIGAKSLQDLQKVRLLLHTGVFVVQNSEIYLLQEHLDFFLIIDRISSEIYTEKGVKRADRPLT